MKIVLTLLFLVSSGLAQRMFPAQPVSNYRPITGGERLHWFVVSTVGPTSLLAAGPLSAAIGTAMDRPKEYGPHWDGFGSRYGMRLTGISTGNAMEAGLGSLWGEDPRYFRSGKGGVGGRVKYAIGTTFLAPGREGQWRPAYARLAGDLGNNFLSNAWRVDSESGAGDALLRSLLGVAARMGGNAFQEFWPDLSKKMLHRNK